MTMAVSRALRRDQRPLSESSSALPSEVQCELTVTTWSTIATAATIAAAVTTGWAVGRRGLAGWTEVAELTTKFVVERIFEAHRDGV